MSFETISTGLASLAVTISYPLPTPPKLTCTCPLGNSVTPSFTSSDIFRSMVSRSSSMPGGCSITLDLRLSCLLTFKSCSESAFNSSTDWRRDNWDSTPMLSTCDEISLKRPANTSAEFRKSVLKGADRGSVLSCSAALKKASSAEDMLTVPVPIMSTIRLV